MRAGRLGARKDEELNMGTPVWWNEVAPSPRQPRTISPTACGCGHLATPQPAHTVYDAMATVKPWWTGAMDGALHHLVGDGGGQMVGFCCAITE